MESVIATFSSTKRDAWMHDSKTPLDFFCNTSRKKKIKYKKKGFVSRSGGDSLSLFRKIYALRFVYA